MTRHILILMLALSMAAMPLLGRAQNEASGFEADADAAASCARIQLGAVLSESDTADAEAEVETDVDVFTGAQPHGYGYHDPSAEYIEQELYCDDVSTPGPLKCYDGDITLECEYDGTHVYCPYQY